VPDRQRSDTKKCLDRAPQLELDHSFYARTLLFNVLQLSIAMIVV